MVTVMPINVTIITTIVTRMAAMMVLLLPNMLAVSRIQP
jgi:hypothetical protein